MTTTRRVVGAGFAVAVIAALIPLAVAYACTASAMVVLPSASPGAPPQATAGSVMHVTVINVYSSAPVSVSLLNGPYLGGGTTGPTDSSFNLDVTVPALPPSTQYVLATIAHSGKTYHAAPAMFQVVPAGQSGSNTSTGGVTQRTLRPGGAPQTDGTPTDGGAAAQQSTASAGTLSAPVSDAAARALARDNLTGPLVAPAARTTKPDQTPTFAMNNASTTGNPLTTGLAIGAITLAVALPMLVIGFGAVFAYQRRTARATHRKDL